MEIYQNIGSIESYGNMVQLEIKPMKGVDFDQDVQAFEQAFKLNGIDEFNSLNVENVVTNFDNALFEKVGEYKLSVDQKRDELSSFINSPAEYSLTDLLKLQCELGSYVIEVTLVTNTSDKVSNGITTLFQTQ
ncbi:hypothetical protein [Desulfosarcina variabilis]|uniref:hypothetical protein n=1 Tax=Desulfosarcina variabilis TaxID=2300 RepID=UPI003AFB6A95